MKNIRNSSKTGLKVLVNLDKKSSKLPKPTIIQKESLHAQNRFEAVYYSNKLEGNKLTKEESRKAILFK